ncbi:ABC transporter permease [Roseomonas sp. GC11]|uniref:ABC transporter permease n=1 Tax=Roseomonas sp. GC11 TaxID=2950546 RepID=UPI00210EC68D|nr:ABC transporter permease [Roseomonas sp. GC11]MCQ4162356.1 ABC transporter permease [Roseomonas sp. GC11]
MARYLAWRLAALLPVLALVLVIVFTLSRLIPGDPATTLLGPGATSAQIAALRAQLHLDEAPLLQFTAYLGGLAQGDLGRSLKSGAPVLEEILLRLPATLELSLLALLLALLAGIPIGVWSAVRANSGFDHAVRVVSLAGVSMPAFLFALLLQLVFGVWLGWLPVSGRASPFFLTEPVTGFAILDALLEGDGEAALDAFLHLLLPTTVLAAFLAATLGRFVRNAMLEVLGDDFVRTARAKGLREGAVVFRHALRNALLPALTIVGLKFAEMLGGAVLTETVFAWPGIGRYMFDAIRNRDYPVIQGTTLVFALIFLLTALLVDLLSAWLDPRLRRGMR